MVTRRHDNKLLDVTTCDGALPFRGASVPVGLLHVFIESKKSALVLVWRIFSKRNSMASTVPIGCNTLRNSQTRFNSFSDNNNSSFRVPERVTSMAGKTRLSAI